MVRIFTRGRLPLPPPLSVGRVPGPRRGRWSLGVAAALVLVPASAAAAGSPTVAASHHGVARPPAGQPSRAGTPRAGRGPDGLSTSVFANDFEAAPYTGNGYLAQRVPAAGMGFLGGLGTDGWPLYDTRVDGAQVAGVYAVANGMQRIAQVPTWSTMDFASPSGTYSPASVTASSVSGYAQRLDLRTGTVRTRGVWTAPGGETTGFAITVFADRAAANLAAVQLSLTPQWSGTGQVTSVLDGQGTAGLTPVDAGFDPTTAESFVTDTTQGLGTWVSEAATLATSANVTVTGVHDVSDPATSTAGEQLSFSVSAGQTYVFTKYVAVYRGAGTTSPEPAARTASQGAAQAGWASLAGDDAAAWAALWGGGAAARTASQPAHAATQAEPIQVVGDPALQQLVDASQYNLWASVSPTSADSISPAGLSSDNYAGLVFWDADTWMFPALLAQHPDLAAAIVSYRDRTLAAAEANASGLGYQGAFYPWTSASDGVYATNCYGGSCGEEIHLQADIALAQWQYYQATGDSAWLKADGWPVIQALAQFWAARATPGPSGTYRIEGIQPPDEYASGVSDDPYTNAAAAQTLRIATQAAAIVGQQAPASWAAIAQGLTASLPFDRTDGVYAEYDGYSGQTVKQADVTMLTYPLRFAMPAATGLADLDYYSTRTDLGGPAMTQAIASIDASLLGQAGCASYTYLVQSYRPFVHAPFDQFAELLPPGSVPQAPGGENLSEPAFDFLTGAGGFLQEFLYGFSGLQLTTTGVSVDPSLPPQLRGLVLRDVRWQGRTLTVALSPGQTTVTLTAGPALSLDFAGQTTVLQPGASVTGPTRSPAADDPAADLAQCQPTSATSSAVYSTPAGATDGTDATNWTAAAAHAALTIDLGQSQTIREVVVKRGTSAPFRYSVQLSADGKTWTTAGQVAAASGGTDDVPTGTRAARYLRLAFPGGGQLAPPVIDEVSVYGGAQLTSLQVSGGTWAAPIGSTAQLTTTLTNVGSVTATDVQATLSAPAGWQVVPVTPATSPSLAPGQRLVTRWQVSVPAATRAGSYRLNAAATYTYAGQGQPVTQTSDEEIQAVQVCPVGQACQAEDGTLLGLAAVASNQSGYTGTGFTVIEHTGDGVLVYVTAPTAGSYQLQTRYANWTGGAQPPYQTETRWAEVSVNDSLTSTLQMPVTGSWSTWDTGTAAVTLRAGVNAVGLYCGPPDNCAVNIDDFTVTGGS